MQHLHTLLTGDAGRPCPPAPLVDGERPLVAGLGLSLVGWHLLVRVSLALGHVLPWRLCRVLLLRKVMHLVLNHLLLLVQEVNRLVDMWRPNDRWLMNEFLLLHPVHVFKLLILLLEQNILLHDLPVLLRSHLHLALVNDALPIFYLM
jgi:hypothetical protein